MRREEIDDDARIWTLPGAQTKNGRPHLVHLSNPARVVLSAVPRQGPLTFSLDDNRLFQNIGRSGTMSGGEAVGPMSSPMKDD